MYLNIYHTRAYVFSRQSIPPEKRVIVGFNLRPLPIALSITREVGRVAGTLHHWSVRW